MPAILLIDDDQMVQSVTTEILEFLGYTVLNAENGRQALDILQAQADSINLILLDLSLPDIEGVEMIPLIREIRQDVKIILCTGAVANLDSQTFAGSGILAILQKPFELSDLKETLERYLYINPA